MQIDNIINRLMRIDDRVYAVEKFCLCLLLFLMVVISFFSVVSRLFFNVCSVGCIDIVQNMVLWCTFLGGSIGSRKNIHLSINVFQGILTGRSKTIINIILYIVVSIISAFLAWSGNRFCLSQYEFGESLPSIGINIWVLQVILPYTFAIVSLRYLFSAIKLVFGIEIDDEDRQLIL